MKSRLFTFFLSFISFFSYANGAKEDFELIVLLSDSSTITCDFAKAPQMTLTKNRIVLENTNGETFRWEFDEVLSWSFGELDIVNDVTTQQPHIALSNNHVCVSGKPNTLITICDIGGNVMVRKYLEPNRETHICLTELKRGIYILKAGTAVMKFSTQ